MLRTAIVFLVVVASIAGPAFAQKNTVEKSMAEKNTAEKSAKTASKNPASELEKTQQLLDEAVKKKAAIAEEAKTLRNELDALQSSLVPLTQQLQEQQIRVASLQEKLRALAAQEEEAQARYASRRAALKHSVGIMLRLSQTPPEAVVAMPGDYADTVKTANMLGVISEEIRKEAHAIDEELSQLHTIQSELATTESNAVREQKTLSARHETLANRLSERQKLQSKLNREEERQAARIAELSRKADSLKDLVANLEKERKARADAEAARQREAAARRKVIAPTPEAAPEKPEFETRDLAELRKGKLRLPLRGKITAAFGDAEGPGDSDKGLVLQGEKNTTVVAPFDGQVVFTGPFRDYGNIVILRHAPDFHSLLIGVNRIQCSPGQYLLGGEPVGRLDGDSKTPNRLYFELRKNNKPIDPAAWIARNG